MNRFVGSDAPLLGVTEIDRQHRSMVDGFRFLRCAPRRHASDLKELARIVDEVRSHFVWEEAEMAKAEYPDTKSHSKDHDLQLANLRDLRKYVDEGNEQLDEDFFRAAEELGIDLSRPERGSDEEDARRQAERG